MSTQNQIEANRLNAQKSTGPNTPEGKAASSRNAMKSGLYSDQPYIPGESKEDFAKLQADYFEEFHPTTVEERFLVDKLIRNEWLLRRFARIEDQLFAAQFRQAEEILMGCELGQLFQQNNTVYMRLERRVRNAEKAHKDAINELNRLRKLSPDLASFRQPAPKEPPARLPRPVSAPFPIERGEYAPQTPAIEPEIPPKTAPGA